MTCPNTHISELYGALHLPALRHSQRVNQPDYRCRGSDCFYPQLLKNKQTAEAILLEVSLSPEMVKFEFPKNAFVYWSHQDYQFLYFVSDYNADPPVYLYFEELDFRYQSPPRKKWDHLSEQLTFFIEEIEGKEAQVNFLTR